MTETEFIQLQKDVYRPGPRWQGLIALYNQNKGTDLDPNRRSTYITILQAIAEKNGFDFKPIDIQKYFPTH